MNLSCVVLSSDSHINKGNSILHCLTSILNQNFQNYEVIVIENSNLKNKNNLEELNKIKKKFESQKIQFTLVNNEKKISRGLARNKGINIAKGDIIIFIDDDTIILEDNVFNKICNLAQKYDFGYGAIRFWTSPKGWFEKNSKDILQKLEKRKNPFQNHIGNIQSNIRDNEYLDLQHYTFIANFGFCKKELLTKSKGFPDFKGYGCEDDFFMFKLFKISGNYTILRDIKVVHVTHKTSPNNNFPIYVEKLKEEGYFWLHIGKTFYDLKQLSRDEVLERLSSYHPDYRTAIAYQEYQKSCPPNISQKETILWKQNSQYCFIDFIQSLKKLLDSSSLDEYIQHSNSDFDNIIPFLDVCIKNKFCKISPNGEIFNTFKFKHFLNRSKERPFIQLKNPQSTWNQFPCDINSRQRRVDLIKNRYPYTDHIRIALIGDDDLITVPLYQYSWIQTSTIDLDKKVLNTINKYCPNAETHNLDLTLKLKGIKSVHTFFTDPPYTLNGALLFIVRGLSLLDYNGEVKEFFVILNQTMMGRNIEKILKIFTENGVWLHETIVNFSQYCLPEKYPERKRANIFLIENNIRPKSVSYSSSSNLYIFRTISPNIQALESLIDTKQIYNHLL
jgi:predicted methyltransferase/GT2 family glycosyltransferase